MLYYLMTELLKQVRSCMVCQEQLLHVPRPIIQFSPHAKIAIVGQAPGRRVHETGIPWNDASGRKLREWLSVAERNSASVSLVPNMLYCFQKYAG
jgi:uracil-DNA glycosylase